MMLLLSTFACALLMGVGISLSGMTSSLKSFAFFDVLHPSADGPFGGWDASMLCAFMGALLLNVLLYPVVVRSKKPLMADRFLIPTSTQLTPELVGGSLLFGFGWMLGGFCPGPAVLSMVGGSLVASAFTVAMFAGWHARKLSVATDTHELAYAWASIVSVALLGVASFLIWGDGIERMPDAPFDAVRAIAGGLTIGSAVLLYLYLNGSILGLSGIFSGLVDPQGGGHRLLRAAFFAGFATAGALVRHLAPHLLANPGAVSLPRAVLGGLCVGFGTAVGSGCTSGHGICGLSRFSPRSIVATACFFGAAMVSIQLVILFM